MEALTSLVSNESNGEEGRRNGSNGSHIFNGARTLRGALRRLLVELLARWAARRLRCVAVRLAAGVAGRCLGHARARQRWLGRAALGASLARGRESGERERREIG
jgi:hypothetical protein